MAEEQKIFTKEDALAMSILDVASSLGMEFKKRSSTSYKWTEHDSLVIDTRANFWNWFSKGRGGDVINLVQEIKGVSFKEAMHYLKTGEFPTVSIQEENREPFRYTLAPYEQPFQEARSYLKEQRGLSDETIDFFMSQGVLAQATKKAQDGYLEPVVVFKFLNQNKKVVGASLQGITPNKERYEGRGYLKQILYNSDGLHGLSVDIGTPKRLVFAEAPIDLMSYYELNRGILSDVRLVAMDGLKSGTIARHTMQLLAELEGVKDYQFNPQKIDTVLKAFQTTSFFKEEKNQDFITLAVDNDKAGREFLSTLKERGVPAQSALPPLKEGQEKTDWNDVLRETKKESKFENVSKDNSRLAQARRKLERLKGEASDAIDKVYTHTSLANGQPMNDKRGRARYFRRQDKLENRVVTKLDEIKKQEERVEQLEWQEGLKENGFNRSGNGLALTVDNIPRIREAIEKFDNGEPSYSRATINRYRQKLVELEALQKQLEETTVSAGAQYLIDKGLVTQWQKHPTTFFVKGLRKVAFDLGEDGNFQVSQKYAPKTDKDQEEVDNLLLIQSTQTRIDELISDVALTGEGFYLWHDYELEELGASEEIVQEFHNRLEDIRYEKDGINLYVEDSVNDGATGYLSLEGNVLDSEGIRDYLSDSELSISAQVDFLTNLETAVDETWDKVVEHYDQVFHEVVLKYGLRQSEEKQEEIAMKQEDVPTIEMATEASSQSRNTIRSEIDDNLTFKVEPVKSVVIGAEEIEELVSETDIDVTEKTELLSEEREQEVIPTPKYLHRIDIDGVELVSESGHFSTLAEAQDWLLTHFMNQVDRGAAAEGYFKTDLILTFMSIDGELEEFKVRLDIGFGSSSFTPNHQDLFTYLNKSYASYFEDKGFILETTKEEAEKARIQELLQHPVFRDSTDTIDYLLENYVTSQELEMLISYFEHESELPISLTQAQYALTEVEATLNIDAFVNSFEQKSEYLDRNIKAFKNSRPNYQDTPAEEIYQIYKYFQHPVFRNYSDTIDYLLSRSVSSQELETFIARFEHGQKLPIPLFTATAALEEVRAEKEKAQGASQEQQKNAEGTIGDFPDKQEAAPLPEATISQPLNDLSPSQTQPQPYLHFTIKEDGKSIDKRYYHPASLKDISKLNRYASNIQQTAKWYLDTVADSRIIYLYQDGETVSSLAVQFDRDKFMHLTGIFPYREGQTAEQTLLDFANGKGDFDSILIANKGATFDKIKVLPELEAIIESDSFYFGDLSEVPKLHQLNLDKAIRSGDEDVVLAMRTVDGTTFPASLMKLRQSLKLQLDHSNEAKTILGVYRERDGVIDQLSINEELVKDGGKAMLSILTNKQYEEMVERIDDKESVLSRLDELKKERKERELDHFYADSWEQAGQISKDIERLDKEIAEAENLYQESLEQGLGKSRDSDGDGVSDEVERSLGTNPYDVTSSPYHRSKKETDLSKDSSPKTLSDILKDKDTKALSAHLKEGMKEYTKSDQYKNFLTAMSKFHDYSVRNIQLMLAQNRDITHVASYQTWKKEFDRQVQKGEKGLKIFVPVQVKVRDENGEVKKDENGKEMTVTRFTFGTVFDVKQTEGKEVPKPIHLLEGSVPDYENLYRAARQVSLDNHVPISFKVIKGDANGYYNLETREIVIAEKQMSEVQIMKTLFHEMAHSRLHHQVDGFTTVERELQAESIAYVVASHYGIDTSDYSFAYLHSWSQDQRNYSDLEAQLKVIQSESKRMMEKIDVRLEEVKTKSKFADKLQSKLEKAEAETKQAIEQKKSEEKTQMTKKSPTPRKEH